MQRFVKLSFLTLLASATCVFAQTPEDNPIFKSSVDWLSSPVACENADAKTETEMKAYAEKIPGTEVTFKMVPIKGGKFLFGSPENEANRGDDEGPQVEIEIAPFWMEEHEVTWKEFEQFALKYLRQAHASDASKRSSRSDIADALCAPTAAYNISSISYGRAGKVGYPASGMTAYAAMVYCKWLTALTGRYYRLPTEAEWEYACRAGTTTPHHFGTAKELDDLDDYAWHFDNVEEGYMPVKKKKPNPWGLYDMYGNVAEWCLDAYNKDVHTAWKDGKLTFVKADRKTLSGFGSVARGGSCDDDDVKHFRSARRIVSTAKWKAQDPQFPQSIWWVTDAPFVGFRIVRPLTPPTAEEAAEFDALPDVWFQYQKLNQRE
ncbi:MAG: formylglycine-generating enzyme family protein [Thermoguttaceae bacterium]